MCHHAMHGVFFASYANLGSLRAMAVSHCIFWYQSQFILMVCRICYYHPPPPCQWPPHANGSPTQKEESCPPPPCQWPPFLGTKNPPPPTKGFFPSGSNCMTIFDSRFMHCNSACAYADIVVEACICARMHLDQKRFLCTVRFPKCFATVHPLKTKRKPQMQAVQCGTGHRRLGQL